MLPHPGSVAFVPPSNIALKQILSGGSKTENSFALITGFSNLPEPGDSRKRLQNNGLCTDSAPFSALIAR
jgi:hypothetical protein